MRLQVTTELRPRRLHGSGVHRRQALRAWQRWTGSSTGVASSECEAAPASQLWDVSCNRQAEGRFVL